MPICQWAPQVQYHMGDIVEYEGHRYTIIQPHSSQSDWTPPATPALWSRLPDEGHWEPHPDCHPPEFHGNTGPSHDDQQKVHETVPHEEQQKSWYDIDPHRKKQLEVAGGLAVGLGLLGGGYMAYQGHKKSEEEKKAQVWGLQAWIRDAQARTNAFYQQGRRGGLTWILTKGRQIPKNAIVGGNDNGRDLFICRAFYEGGLQVGKASSHFKEGGVIGYKHHEINVDTYEILVGDQNVVDWVGFSGRFNPERFNGNTIEGGREADGTLLYVVQAPYHGGLHPGKAGPGLPSAFIPYDGSEKEVKEYRVAVKAF